VSDRARLLRPKSHEIKVFSGGESGPITRTKTKKSSERNLITLPAEWSTAGVHRTAQNSTKRKGGPQKGGQSSPKKPRRRENELTGRGRAGAPVACKKLKGQAVTQNTGKQTRRTKERPHGDEGITQVRPCRKRITFAGENEDLQQWKGHLTAHLTSTKNRDAPDDGRVCPKKSYLKDHKGGTQRMGGGALDEGEKGGGQQSGPNRRSSGQSGKGKEGV